MMKTDLRMKAFQPKEHRVVWDEELFKVKSVGNGELVLERKHALDYGKLRDSAKVRCVKKDDYDGSLIPGKVYTVSVVSHLGGEVSYRIYDESFDGYWDITDRTEHLFANY